MPVFQIYFADNIASEIQRFSDEDGITTKEYIQRAVGKELAESRKKKKTTAR